MSDARRLPLLDPAVQPSSWNQRMAPHEFAVHYSSFAPNETPFCDVLPSLAQASAHARDAVQQHPALRCRVYDAQGMVGAPLFEASGPQYKGETNLSTFRRWVGSVCFTVGSALALVDVAQDYRLMWPSTIGTRMLVPGAVLLLTEGLVMLSARQNAKRSAAQR